MEVGREAVIGRLERAGYETVRNLLQRLSSTGFQTLSDLLFVPANLSRTEASEWILEELFSVTAEPTVSIFDFDPAICTNREDVTSLDPVEDISPERLVWYPDLTGRVWCFDVETIKTLLDRGGQNPYNRQPIPAYVRRRVREIRVPVVETSPMEIG